MPEHKNLAAALAAFQAEMPSVPKSKTAKVKMKNGGEFSYSYADLADVTAAAMPLLSAHGLSFSSLPRQTEKGGYELAGTLLHASGEERQGALPLSGQTAQEIGSSITYMRRYLLGCLTGIVTDDDDDGRAASEAPRTQAPTSVQSDATLDDDSVAEVLQSISRSRPTTDALRGKLVALGVSSVPEGQITRGTIQRLTSQQAVDLVAWLDSQVLA